MFFKTTTVFVQIFNFFYSRLSNCTIENVDELCIRVFYFFFVLLFFSSSSRKIRYQKYSSEWNNGMGRAIPHNKDLSFNT